MARAEPMGPRTLRCYRQLLMEKGLGWMKAHIGGKVHANSLKAWCWQDERDMGCYPPGGAYEALIRHLIAKEYGKRLEAGE